MTTPRPAAEWEMKYIVANIGLKDLISAIQRDAFSAGFAAAREACVEALDSFAKMTRLMGKNAVDLEAARDAIRAIEEPKL
jgi:hypothetical protein